LQGRHAENLAAMHIPKTVEVLSKILSLARDSRLKLYIQSALIQSRVELLHFWYNNFGGYVSSRKSWQWRNP
jgi:hypothetical protein